MSSSKSYISIGHIWFLIVIIYVVIVSKFATSQTPLINNICHQTDFPSFCINLLMSFPASSSPRATLKTLIDVTSGVIINNATASLMKVQDWINLERGDQDALRICHTMYENVRTNAQKIKVFFRQQKVAQASNSANLGFAAVVRCQDAFTGYLRPLDGYNLMMKRMWSMIGLMLNSAE